LSGSDWTRQNYGYRRGEAARGRAQGPHKGLRSLAGISRPQTCRKNLNTAHTASRPRFRAWTCFCRPPIRSFGAPARS
jgi:hypothetical protein